MKDGGPAFPRLDSLSADCGPSGSTVRFAAVNAGGMSLRDYFAAQIVGASVAANATLIALLAIGKDHGRAVTTDDSTLAKGAYKLADAMLAEREKVK